MTPVENLIEHCEHIDAAIFSSDALQDPEYVKTLREYLDRWNRNVLSEPSNMHTDFAVIARSVAKPDGVLITGVDFRWTHTIAGPARLLGVDIKTEKSY